MIKVRIIILFSVLITLIINNFSIHELGHFLSYKLFDLLDTNVYYETKNVLNLRTYSKYQSNLKPYQVRIAAISGMVLQIIMTIITNFIPVYLNKIISKFIISLIIFPPIITTIIAYLPIYGKISDLKLFIFPDKLKDKQEIEGYTIMTCFNDTIILSIIINIIIVFIDTLLIKKFL